MCIFNFQNDKEKTFDFNTSFEFDDEEEQNIVQKENTEIIHQFNNDLHVIEKTSSDTDGKEFDIGKWPKDMSLFINFWIHEGSKNLQHDDENLLSQKSIVQIDEKKKIKRRCTIKMFLRNFKSGHVKRTWLCFSPSTGKIYCFYCKLFNAHTSCNQFSDAGFSDWNNAHARIRDHEKSSLHIKTMYKFAKNSGINYSVNRELEKQMDNEKNYYRKLLKRVFSVVVFMAKRGLPFRGDNNIIGSPHNGNFLGLIELLAEYDEFLKNHLKNYGNCGSGYTNYLSSTTYEEIIAIIDQHVLFKIISNIKKSKYYSISVDSTSDVAHVDQLCISFRYIEYDEPIDRFLKFLPNQGHKGVEMYDAVQKFYAYTISI